RMNYALYFSRAPIPLERPGSLSRIRPKPGEAATTVWRAPHWVHLGLYAFRRPFLFRFAALPPSTLEQSERLEQLRVLEHGCSIKVVVVPQATCGVDRPGDVKKVERILAKSQTREPK